MGELVTKEVNFNGASLMAVQTEDKKIHVGVKWVCQGLGLTEGQTKAERARIQQDLVLSKLGRKIVLPSQYGNKETLLISINGLPLWLAKINVNIINDPAVQDKLIEYQLHAADVLAKAFIEDRIIPKEKPNKIKEQEIEARLLNAQVRKSSMFYKLAEKYSNNPQYREMLYAKSAEALEGRMIIPLPEAGQRTYSAKEIALMFGVSAKRIGMIANEHNLKTSEYGRLFVSKSEFSVKEVETWRYYENVIPMFTRILAQNVKPLEIIKGGVVQ